MKRYISTIGLFNAKAKNVIATCRILVEQHGGEVPRTREALEALPGVGRKTANVVLNTAFGEPTIAVDTHIFRVANRTGLAPGKNVRIVEDKLNKVVPPEFRKDAHHWLILHGRYVCKARKPDMPALRDQRLVRIPSQDRRNLTSRDAARAVASRQLRISVIQPSSVGATDFAPDSAPVPRIRQ